MGKGKGPGNRIKKEKEGQLDGETEWYQRGLAKRGGNLQLM